MRPFTTAIVSLRQGVFARVLGKGVRPLLVVSGFAGALALAGCGVTPGCRAVTGAGIGAAGGAVIGALAGAPALGAAAGAAGGGLLGAATPPGAVNLGPSPFCQ